jgi:uncharacterized protein
MASALWARLAPHLDLEEKGLVALSGGADSSVLLAALVKANGSEKVVAATFRSPLHNLKELARAEALTRRLKVVHLVLDEDPFIDPNFTQNPENRCYLCKSRRLDELFRLAGEKGLKVILDGSNLSDTEGYRPGRRAVEERGVLTPLAAAGLTKTQVTELGRELGLAEWLKPASSCLATRVSYGQKLEKRLLERIGRAEELVGGLTGAELGSFRVRVQGRAVRLETAPSMWPLLIAAPLRSDLLAGLKRLGFVRISLDLEPFSSGSLDRALGLEQSGRD